jgi:hypothetical protein
LSGLGGSTDVYLVNSFLSAPITLATVSTHYSTLVCDGRTDRQTVAGGLTYLLR